MQKEKRWGRERKGGERENAMGANLMHLIRCIVNEYNITLPSPLGLC
jgi:hypothetical protein